MREEGLDAISRALRCGAARARRDEVARDLKYEQLRSGVGAGADSVRVARLVAEHGRLTGLILEDEVALGVRLPPAKC